MVTQGRFNVRAYGIWINRLGEVLLSAEQVHHHRIIKFPGGGLRFGEGLLECLRREWREETGLDLQVIRHYYTTDFYQPSAFSPEDQVISVYYLVRCAREPMRIPSLEGSHEFHWLPLEALKPEAVTLPIDKVVAQKLRHDFADVVAGAFPFAELDVR